MFIIFSLWFVQTTLSELSVQLFSGNLNDAGILDKQLNMFNNFQPNSNNILLGDSGYDSNNIKNKLKNMKFGKLLTYKNKRNTKDKKKLNDIKLSNKEILILKNKRIKIEHINAKLKNYKKIIIRYDKKTKNKRNTKDKKKLNNIKLSNKEILILKNKRIKIEHINAKIKKL